MDLLNITVDLEHHCTVVQSATAAGLWMSEIQISQAAQSKLRQLQTPPTRLKGTGTNHPGSKDSQDQNIRCRP